MASPTVVAVGAVAAAASGDATPGWPAGLQANDIVLLFLSQKDNVASTASGFTEKANGVRAANHKAAFLWYRATGSESGTFTVSHTGGNSIVARAVAVRGCASSGDPFDAVTASTTASPTASLDPTVVDTLCGVFVSHADDPVPTGAAGGGLTWTDQVSDGTTSGTDTSEYVATAPYAGDTAFTVSFTGGTAGALAWAFALAPGSSSTTETPGVGAATAAGVTPTASLTATPAVGAATGAGVTPTASVTVTPVPGAAVAAGVSPTDDALATTPTPGSATAAGVAPTASVTVTPPVGAAVAAGVTPASSTRAVPVAAQATAAGIGPMVRILAVPGVGAAVGAGVTPTVSVTAIPTPGAAVAAGVNIGAVLALVGLNTPRTADLLKPGPTFAAFEAPARAASLERPATAAAFERPLVGAAFEQAEAEVVFGG